VRQDAGRFNCRGLKPRAKLIDADRTAIRQRKADILAWLRREFQANRAAYAEASSIPPARAPAYSIVETCRRYGVALSIDKNGCLVVGKAGANAAEPSQPWPSLVMALEAHYEGVAALAKAGWVLTADFPKNAQARTTDLS
jgi:hypothetical protein